MPVTLPGPGKAIVHLSEYDISNPCTAKLLKSERITPKTEGEVRHLVLELPEGDFDFVEGQSIGVLVPGPHEFGNAYHFRLYSIASSRKGDDGKCNSISICVRRCFYIDEISGERFPGIASNYLCDAKPGDPIRIAGPYGAHFNIPTDPSVNLLMIGTAIAQDHGLHERRPSEIVDMVERRAGSDQTTDHRYAAEMRSGDQCRSRVEAGRQAWIVA